MSDQQKLWGLKVLGFVFIISSLAQIRVIANYDWYQFCVSYLPPETIFIRYIISWAQRIIGLSIGAGLIAHRRWAAQLAIYLSVFEVMFAYWKYPYESFKIQCAVWDKQYGWMIKQAGFPKIHFSSYVIYDVVFSCVLHVLFFGFVLYYLTRPYVKERLK